MRSGLLMAYLNVQHQHKWVHIEVERRAEALDECDHAAAGVVLAPLSGPMNEIGFNGADDHTQNPDE